MNRPNFSGNVRSYNGEGRWAVATVQSRYRDYCDVLKIDRSRSLAPVEHREGDVHWIYPVMEEVIKGIEGGDLACVALGIDFLEEDTAFPFGRTLKSNTARALRRTSLTELQKARLRERIAGMLALGIVPRHMREYAKLLRKIGVAEQWPRLERDIPRNNPYAMRFYKTLRTAEGLSV